MFKKKRYILRLDDACPTTNWKQWDMFETMCDSAGIKPLVSVIPNNQDPKLMIDPPLSTFWDKVRGWQDKGWMIALHGYDHVYVTQSGGLLPINLKSEFAGLEYDIQKQKIEQGLAIFKEQGINTCVFVAPSHSFDEVTCKVLHNHSQINIISDGMSYYPYRKYNMLWLPQQSWRLEKKWYGIWTFCYHPNTLPDDQFGYVNDFCHQYANLFVDNLEDIYNQYQHRQPSWLDQRFEKQFFEQHEPFK